MGTRAGVTLQTLTPGSRPRCPRATLTLLGFPLSAALLGRMFLSRKSGVRVIETLDRENVVVALELGELFFPNETLVSPKLL